MKIVVYNYVQPGEPNSPGGGVSVYLQTLVGELRARGATVYTLSGGDRYDLLYPKPRVVRLKSGTGLVIHNSPVVAPALASFEHPEIYLRSKGLDHIPQQLRALIGEVDVFHFHNIEGLTRGFFWKLRQTYPASGLFFSAHNYNITCPQVALWYRGQEACTDFENGLACTRCTNTQGSRARRILLNRLKTRIKSIESTDSVLKKAAYAWGARPATSLIRAKEQQPVEHLSVPPARTRTRASDYLQFRQANIEICRDVFDRVFAVSRRTRDVLLRDGIDAANVEVLYIGTRYAAVFQNSKKKLPTADALHLGYIGYMRREKGFYYLLDALESLPTQTLGRLELTIAAKFTDMAAVERLRQLEPRLKHLHLFDGYTHANLPAILEPINLGVVPPQWEDNLPQVALEFLASGIPIVTSNRGGAQEIVTPNDLVVDAKDSQALVQLLSDIASGTRSLEGYWNRSIRIPSMTWHVDELYRRYAGVGADPD